jgi:sulfate adenylyltransferase
MNQPHGGTLVNRIAKGARKTELENKAKSLFQLTIDDRYGCDVEMIANGAFSPLTGFMNKADSEGTIEKMTLSNGLLWGIPILLPSGDQHDKITIGSEIALIEKSSGNVLAIMTVEEKFELDIMNLAQKCFKTTEEKHPGVKAVLSGGNRYISGPLEMINRPTRHDQIDDKYFMDPTETRAEFEKRNWKTVVAFQTRNPIHRAHEYLIKCAQEIVDGALIHPIVGETKPDDIPAPVRMRCYEVLINGYFNPDNTMVSALPTAMRYAGPREAINHTLIRKNYGCTHMIVGRDHAGVGTYYGTYEAQEMMDSVADRTGRTILKFENTFYCKETEGMASSKTAPKNATQVSLSGTKVREMLAHGQRPPAEFSRAEVADILIEWATAKTAETVQ